MKSIALVGLLMLAACTDPTLSAGMVIGPDGVAVQPVVSGQVGGATVSFEPN